MAKKKRKKSADDDISTIIQKAVDASFTAGRLQGQRAPDDFYKATERRLYALPVLQRKLESLREKLEDLETAGSPRRSKDVKRLCRPGVRLSPDEVLDALIADCKADIAVNEHEVEVIQEAMEGIEDDPYYSAISGRYFDGLSDEEIAEQIPCAAATVRRNRKRLIRGVAVWLYGAEAIN
jgi:hypothetical protein